MADDDRIIRIETKIDKISDHLGNIDVTLASQHQVLKDHIHRTELLEKAVIPLTKHDHMVLGVIKLSMILASIGAGIEGILKLIHG